MRSPAAAKMSITPSEATAREMIWRTAWSNSSSGPRSIDGALGQRRSNGLEEADIIGYARCLFVGNGEGKCLGELADGG